MFTYYVYPRKQNTYCNNNKAHIFILYFDNLNNKSGKVEGYIL